MRRRTKPKVVWLPKDGRFTIQDTNVISAILEIDGAVGTVTTGIVSVVIDEPQDELVATTTLSDVENSGYRLRRIVGKCFVGVDQAGDTGGPPAVLVAAAFIVLRVDEGGDPISTNLNNYDLFRIQNDDSPWIWRREWALSNGNATITGGDLDLSYPFTNSEYGSVSDGPHIDQKTARLISNNERLFLVLAGMPIVAGVNEQSPTAVQLHVTPRVLVSMRNNLGNRRNATR